MGVKEGAPVVCLPALQLNGLEGTLLVRSGLRPVELDGLVRAELKQVDPSARVDYSSTVETAVNSMISRERLIAYLSTAFGALAALLAAVGLYGVMAYDMSRRTSEIGIRMALGAQSRDIWWMALRESLRLICAGVVGGVPAALTTMQFSAWAAVRHPRDRPWVLGVSTLVIFAVALLAGWLPAARAARIDPNSALRQC
jgi:ABC-type antimicrobial peptide transport system permease subunit